MARRRGFVSARLYPGRGGFDPREYIQIAQWSQAGLLADAQSDPEVRSITTEVNKLVVFRRRVLCDASIQELAPRSELPRRAGIRPRMKRGTRGAHRVATHLAELKAAFGKHSPPPAPVDLLSGGGGRQQRIKSGRF